MVQPVRYIYQEKCHVYILILNFRIDSFSCIAPPSSSGVRDGPKKKKQKSGLITRYPNGPLPRGASLKKKQLDTGTNWREEDKDNSPISPIGNSSIHQSLMPVVNENQRSNVIATGSSSLCLEVKRRVARHIAMKEQNRVIPPRSKDTDSCSSVGPVIQMKMALNGATDVPCVSAGSVPRVVGSSRGSEARHSTETNRQSRDKLEVQKRKFSKRGKQVLISPVEYAQRKAATNLPGNSMVQFLEGKCIFYIGGDMQYAGERTRKRMELVCQ